MKDFVLAGGLLSYGPDVAETLRASAVYIDRILKGAKASDLPVEQPTRLELVVNLKTARTLGSPSGVGPFTGGSDDRVATGGMIPHITVSRSHHHHDGVPRLHAPGRAAHARRADPPVRPGRDHPARAAPSIRTHPRSRARISCGSPPRPRRPGCGRWARREEYGGGGLDTFSMCVALEEMSQHRMGLYNPGCGVFGRYPPPAIWAGSKAQIEKYAVPALREGYETFFAITEPSGGSDPAGAIQTRAERRGDKWVLNGRKVFISRAHDAPWGIVFARTDKAKGRGGISCFILEHGTPGFHASAIRAIRTVRDSQRRVLRGLRDPRREPHRRGGPGARPRLRPPGQEPLPLLGLQSRRGGRGAPHGHRARQAALDVRRAAQPAPGHPVDAGRRRGGAARVPLAHLGGRVEGGSRRGRAGRGLDRQALLERGAGPGGRRGGPDPRRLRSVQGVPAGALVSRGARAPHRRRARPRCIAWSSPGPCSARSDKSGASHGDIQLRAIDASPRGGSAARRGPHLPEQELAQFRPAERARSWAASTATSRAAWASAAGSA